MRVSLTSPKYSAAHVPFGNIDRADYSLTSTQPPLFSPTIQFLSFALHLREMPSNGKSPPSGPNQVEQRVTGWFKCRGGVLGGGLRWYNGRGEVPATPPAHPPPPPPCSQFCVQPFPPILLCRAIHLKHPVRTPFWSMGDAGLDCTSRWTLALGSMPAATGAMGRGMG